MLQSKSEVPALGRLHSTARGDLVVARTLTKTFGPGSFFVTGASFWNSLPDHLRSLTVYSCLQTQTQNVFIPSARLILIVFVLHSSYAIYICCCCWSVFVTAFAVRGHYINRFYISLHIEWRIMYKQRISRGMIELFFWINWIWNCTAVFLIEASCRVTMNEQSNEDCRQDISQNYSLIVGIVLSKKHIGSVEHEDCG